LIKKSVFIKNQPDLSSKYPNKSCNLPILLFTSKIVPNMSAIHQRLLSEKKPGLKKKMAKLNF